jgi:hypothetical protein
LSHVPGAEHLFRHSTLLFVAAIMHYFGAKSIRKYSNLTRMADFSWGKKEHVMEM